MICICTLKKCSFYICIYIFFFSFFYGWCVGYWKNGIFSLNCVSNIQYSKNSAPRDYLSEGKNAKIFYSIETKKSALLICKKASVEYKTNCFRMPQVKCFFCSTQYWQWEIQEKMPWWFLFTLYAFPLFFWRMFCCATSTFTDLLRKG